jgi:hypothetical protein
MRLPLTAVVLAAVLLARPDSSGSGTAAGSPPSLGPKLRVLASWPADGATDLGTDPLVVRFNQPLDPATVTSSSFRLEKGVTPVAGSAVPGSDAREWTWRPDSPLLPAGSWRLTVTRDVRSLRGRELEDPFTVRFTTSGLKPSGSFTELDPDLKLVRAPRLGPVPRVRFTFPQSGLGNVYTDEVTIRFSQAMDTQAFLDGEFSLLQGGLAVPGAISFPEDWGAKEVTFTPEQPLFKDSTFQMVVTRDARTARGRYLREEYRAGFGTSPFKGGVKPLRPEDFEDGQPLLPVGRAFHTTTALPGGDLVVAGGQDLGGAPLASCFRYNAAAGTFTPIAPLNTARRKHAAVPSRDGGILVIGGFGPTGATLSSVEAYDPVLDAWNPVAPLSGSRANHTATVIAGTRVLVVGGYTNASGSLAYASGAQVLNQLTGTWSATTGNPVSIRGGHTATLLPDGRVFLAGGTPAAVLVNELYQPATGTFAPSSQPLENRTFHAACLTKTGTVLLAGGGPARAEQYDPAADTHREAGFCPPHQLPVATAPLFPSLTLISGGGRIALIGGLVPGGGEGGGDLVLAQVQLWDPAGNAGEGAFYPMLFDLDVPRAAHTVSQLPNGGWVLMGGFGTDGLTNEKRVTIFQPSQ